MPKLICLDPGHGANTSGKRSPDGSLREYEFNGVVAGKASYHLKRHNFNVLITRALSSSADDVPNSSRVWMANNAKADLFISIHANAYGSGVAWQSPEGYETFILGKGGEAEHVAKLLVKYASVLGVTLRQPTIKPKAFDVLRKTEMPAVLIEHAFMTNINDYAKLKSNAFRDAAAIHIAKAVCEHFGVAWINEPVKPVEPVIDWKSRALDAEATLKKIREALG